MLNKTINLILLFIGFIWLRSSYGKFMAGNFTDTLAPTLNKFASQNPYPFVKYFLITTAIPNVKVFAFLTMYGEAFTALVLTLVPLYFLFVKRPNKLLYWKLCLGLIIGMFLNLTFWLASGWTSPSTDGLNLLMFAVQGISLYYFISEKPQ